MPRSWVRHTEGIVPVRGWLSATIELTEPSQDGRLRTPGDSKGRRQYRRLPGVTGVIVSGQRGRSGVVLTAVVPEHMTVMGPAS
jgi:hypothetical protein